MPRSGRGGARTGNPGTPYPNRSDLGGRQPIATVPGQAYGVAAEQQAAQKVIPTSGSPVIAPPPGGAGPVPPAPQGGGGAPATFVHPPDPSQTFTRPSERPNEPVTHGLPSGPGAGPEALQGLGAPAAAQMVEQGTLVTLLQHLAAQPGASSVIDALASRAASGAR